MDLGVHNSVHSIKTLSSKMRHYYLIDSKYCCIIYDFEESGLSKLDNL